MELKKGKRYVRKDGKITDVMTTTLDRVYPFIEPCSGNMYTAEGLRYALAKEPHSDLVVEYIEPAEAESATPVQSNLSTKLISSEEWREYDFLNGAVYKITQPQMLITRVGGTGHRIVDAEGVTHWVPVDKPFVLRWKAPGKFVEF